jgi:hypothetical protein
MTAHIVTALMFLPLLAGCAQVDRAACAPGERSTVSDLLYFGMAKPTGGVVTDTEWAEFLRTTVTPRFPAGLTAWPASGQWRGADGQVVREDSRVLQLLHPVDAAAESAIGAIIAEYKKRFAQEAVLRVKSRACMSL